MQCSVEHILCCHQMNYIFSFHFSLVNLVQRMNCSSHLQRYVSPTCGSACVLILADMWQPFVLGYSSKQIIFIGPRSSKDYYKRPGGGVGILERSLGCEFLRGSMCAEGMGCGRRWVRWFLRSYS